MKTALKMYEISLERCLRGFVAKLAKDQGTRHKTTLHSPTSFASSSKMMHRCARLYHPNLIAALPNLERVLRILQQGAPPLSCLASRSAFGTLIFLKAAVFIPSAPSSSSYQSIL